MALRGNDPLLVRMDERSGVAERERALVGALALRRIVVTRGGTQGNALVARLRELGATALHCPVLAFAAPDNPAALTEALSALAAYDWLVFTSSNAVLAVAEPLQQQAGLAHAMPAIAVVGPATAAAVLSAGWKVGFMPTRSAGSALGVQLPAAPGTRVLLPRADIASAELPAMLRDRGFEVHEVVAYRTVPAASWDDIARVLDGGSVDAITFTSPSTVTNFLQAARGAGWTLAAAQQDGAKIVCIGDTTAAALRNEKVQPDAVAAEQSVEGLVNALARCLGEGRAWHRHTGPVLGSI